VDPTSTGELLTSVNQAKELTGPNTLTASVKKI
jgi:hypothetical protein